MAESATVRLTSPWSLVGRLSVPRGSGAGLLYEGTLQCSNESPKLRSEVERSVAE